MAKKRLRWDFLAPINLAPTLWLYVDDDGVHIVQDICGPKSFKLPWRRLDMRRKQAAEARAAGKYQP